MIYLFLVSILWALSFSLIKGNLAGLDSGLVSTVRLLLSFVIFFPFVKIRGLSTHKRIRFILLGGLQYGVMYLCYIASFSFLKAHQVALLTIFTPIFVSLGNDIFEKRFSSISFILVLISVVGSGVIVYDNNGVSTSIWGIILMQLSNLAFALGQILFKRWAQPNIKTHHYFSLLYLGAFLVTFIYSIFGGSWIGVEFNFTQVWTLLYLGVVASGICFFFWNVGVTKVGVTTLAIMNNLKIPLAVIVAVIFLQEKANWIQLGLGSGLMGAPLYFIHLRRSRILFPSKNSNS